MAREELAQSGLVNVRFMRGDGEIALPDEAVDFVFAQFGTMFFANPAAGLRNMRKASGRAGP